MDILQWIGLNFYVLFFDIPTIYVFVILLSLSVFLGYYWIGYDVKSAFNAIPLIIFLWLGVLFVVWGGITLGTPSANDFNNITVVTTQYTNIDILSMNSSNYSNTSQFATYNVSNVSEYSITVPSFKTDSSPLEEARKKLGGGLFSNGIGLIGLGIAFFSVGLYYKGSIDNNRNQEEIIARLDKREYILKKYKSTLEYTHIYKIGKIWLCIGLIYSGVYLIITNNIIPILFFIGAIILLYGYYQSKYQPIEPQEYTFDEMIQKINDESNLKKE